MAGNYIIARNASGADHYNKNAFARTTSGVDYKMKKAYARHTSGVDYHIWSSELTILQGNTSDYGSLSNFIGDSYRGEYVSGANNQLEIGGEGRIQYNLPQWIPFAGYAQMNFNILFSQTAMWNMVGYATTLGTWVHVGSTYIRMPGGFVGVISVPLVGSGGYLCLQTFWNGATAKMRIDKIWLS